MPDRFVRQISPQSTEDADRSRGFFSYLDSPNIILLGDPGAGKSHLFKQAAAASGGSFLSARAFMSTPTRSLDATLFIDALDERRAGRGDHNTIDSMVEKLFDRSPEKIRISCRAQDWLGDTDLAAFRPYFDGHGGVVVVALEPLSREEMSVILAHHGVKDPPTFLKEAYERELNDFIVNPQNLIMLAGVVEEGNWPTTRRELYYAATALLLQEHNQTRSRSGEGVYTPDELRDSAGAICATHLIADVEGISLRENDDRPGFPSYRTIGFPDIDRVRAALGRRAFKQGQIEETVEYSHRTTAEYLSAAWLAKRVRGGFPISRVRALIGVDGYPASELRGLHAWLPVFLPEYANMLIEADPFGVLTYGDAASLEPSARRSLIEALAHLASVDPWFRANSWSARGLGALAGPDMVEPFRAILHAEQKNSVLRSVVFDALANGLPLPELEADLTTVLRDTRLPYSERTDAAQALIKIGDPGRKTVCHSYKDLGRSENSIRLRKDILLALYGAEFGFRDVAALLHDALNCEGELSTGSLWSLPDELPVADIPSVLDCLDPQDARTRANQDWRNTSDVLHTFDRLMLRVMKETPEEVTSESLFRWLNFRLAMDPHREGIGRTDEIRRELANKVEILRHIVQHHLEDLRIDDQRLRYMRKLDELTLGVIDRDHLLEWYCDYLCRPELNDAKEEFVYEIALWNSFRGTPSSAEKFQWLWELAESRPSLKPIRDRNLTMPIPDWHDERVESRAQRRAEKQATREENRRNFDDHRAQIRSGAHFEWLDWLAKVYFAMFIDVREEQSPRQRLATQLGESNADIALEGFRALLHRDDLPLLHQHIELHAEGKHYWVSYPIEAGLDEEWAAAADMNSFSDGLLRSALAIDIFCPVPVYTNDRNNKRGWKVWLFENRPQLVHEVYLEIARSELTRGAEYSEVLRLLLTDKALAPFCGRTIIRLLSEFPHAPSNSLEMLIRAVLEHREIHAPFLEVAAKVLEDPRNTTDAWLVAAYLLSPERYVQRLAARAKEGDTVLWQMRDFLGYRPYNADVGPFTLSLDQMAEIVSMTAINHPNAYPPTGSSWGERNPWHAADFLRSLIDRIASDPSERATNLLAEIISNDDLKTYGDHMRHALTNQRARRRELDFVQPDWSQTVGALFRSAPANVSDLHALLFDALQDIKQQIAFSNTDIYKRFWNEDPRGAIDSPKPEESGRDVLVDMLRERLRPLGVIVEPEGHMVADKRTDIWVSLPGRKVLVELKRDYHRDVWNAAENQLDRFYTRDPEASGFGIYGVFWFGPKRGAEIPVPPNGLPRPQSAKEMENALLSLLPKEKRAKIAIIALDVNKPI